MIASAQSLRQIKPVKPFVEKTIFNGMSYGVTAAGYDIRIAENTVVKAKVIVMSSMFGVSPQFTFVTSFSLASSMEEFDMPLYLQGIVHDKSTWARQGLLVQNTVIEPGWKGYLTLEITNESTEDIYIAAGSPIAQVVFHYLDEITDTPYSGKYQNQQQGPVEAILE